MMKLIIAIVKPFKLDEVVDALTAIGVKGLTVSEAKGFGRQKGQTEVYRGAEYETRFVPKVRIETVVSDDVAPAAIEAIAAAAKSETIGDGKIFTLDVSAALRIRTGEADEIAL